MKKIRPVHPFPARMAASLALSEMERSKRKLRVLDPMAGSGTTLIAAKINGHTAMGFDLDPLAVRIANAWCAEYPRDRFLEKARQVLEQALSIYHELRTDDAYPTDDLETKQFIDFWFDWQNRKQLFALSQAIACQRSLALRNLLWCAFSRTIITKEPIVSRARDTSHSRPHKVCSRSRQRLFDVFLAYARLVADRINLVAPGGAVARQGDARRLPIRARSVDMVITSPPYFDAIDYMRGHKLSLVWQGYSISELRRTRGNVIGHTLMNHRVIAPEIRALVRSASTHKAMSNQRMRKLNQYFSDLSAVMREVSRVLVPRGRAVFVVANSAGASEVSTSRAVSCLGRLSGLRLVSRWNRKIPASRRYLPLPHRSRNSLGMRMRSETILKFAKGA